MTGVKATNMPLHFLGFLEKEIYYSICVNKVVAESQKKRNRIWPLNSDSKVAGSWFAK